MTDRDRHRKRTHDHTHTHRHPPNHRPRDRMSSEPSLSLLLSPPLASPNLERVFSHPAGLRVARQVAKSLIEQRPIFGSCPEVMQQLGNILRLSDEFIAPGPSSGAAGTTMAGGSQSQSARSSSNTSYLSANNPAAAMNFSRDRHFPPISASNSQGQSSAQLPPVTFSRSFDQFDHRLPPISQNIGQSTFSAHRNASHLPNPQYPGSHTFQALPVVRHGGSLSRSSTGLPSLPSAPSVGFNNRTSQISNQPPAGGAPSGHLTSNSSQARSATATPHQHSRAEDTSQNTAELRTPSMSRTPSEQNDAAGRSDSVAPHDQPTHAFVPVQFDGKPAKVQIPRKRKAASDAETTKAKKQRTVSKRTKANTKSVPMEPAVWMRVLEFCHPSFLNKARLINKTFNDLVLRYRSVFVNCREENNLPAPAPYLTEHAFNDLLGAYEGCQEPNCPEKKARRTHWSCLKRLCQDCWVGKIEREDKVLKNYPSPSRDVLLQLLECIPSAIQDSFLKPHAYTENLQPIANKPRLYKVYFTVDVKQIITNYEMLNPGPFVEDPAKTKEQNDAARREHTRLTEELPTKQEAFIAERKTKNEDFMAWVKRVEAANLDRRTINKTEIDKNRNGRRALYIKRASEQLPHIEKQFIENTKAFKAATRIYRNAGTERSWQKLMPKIEAEWQEHQEQQKKSAAVAPSGDKPSPPDVIESFFQSMEGDLGNPFGDDDSVYGNGDDNQEDSAMEAVRGLLDLGRLPNTGGSRNVNLSNLSLPNLGSMSNMASSRPHLPNISGSNRYVPMQGFAQNRYASHNYPAYTQVGQSYAQPYQSLAAFHDSPHSFCNSFEGLNYPHPRTSSRPVLSNGFATQAPASSNTNRHISIHSLLGPSQD